MESDGIPTVLDDRADTERVARLLRLISELEEVREQAAGLVARAESEIATRIDQVAQIESGSRVAPTTFNSAALPDDDGRARS